LPVLLSQSEVNDWLWVRANRQRMANAVNGCDNAELLRKFQGLLEEAGEL
jgi:hypothetical protein